MNRLRWFIPFYLVVLSCEAFSADETFSANLVITPNYHEITIVAPNKIVGSSLFSLEIGVFEGEKLQFYSQLEPLSKKDCFLYLLRVSPEQLENINLSFSYGESALEELTYYHFTLPELLDSSK